jgi:hypothetical protein
MGCLLKSTARPMVSGRPSGGQWPRRSPSGGRRRCRRRAKLQHHNESLHPDGAEAQQPQEIGTWDPAERIVTTIKACTGCLRHSPADCGATRRPAADYRAATGNLQDLLSRSALASHVAEHFHLRDTCTDPSRLCRASLPQCDRVRLTSKFNFRDFTAPGIC